ncbi:hypothetical protein FRX31_014590 [Thalictrum thalictroides]|uniref:Uncharacterized protein n=1 Tax=Thalictrum thalictroides TaxID=46969 RepID=A0A7J6WEF7_THATH|nr:hypothetical protein FRX31_014590 [Thalictrum thalictroides]
MPKTIIIGKQKQGPPSSHEVIVPYQQSGVPKRAPQMCRSTLITLSTNSFSNWNEITKGTSNNVCITGAYKGLEDVMNEIFISGKRKPSSLFTKG